MQPARRARVRALYLRAWGHGTYPEPMADALPLDILVASPTRQLSNAQRKQQRRERLEMVRQWWAAGFEEAALMKLCIAKFQVRDAMALKLLHACVALLDEEAEAWDGEPIHAVRHRHRVRMTLILQRAMGKNGSLAVAERCARSLAQLDGVFRQDTDRDEHFLPIGNQAARLIGVDELARTANGGEPLVIDVPVTIEGDE